MPTDAASRQGIASVQTGKAEIQFPEALAIRRTAGPTWPALAAGLVREHDVVAAPNALHSLSDALYDTRTLMAQDYPARSAVSPKVDVGMTDTTGHQPYQHLILTRALELQLLDPQRVGRPAQHGGSDQLLLQSFTMRHCAFLATETFKECR